MFKGLEEEKVYRYHIDIAIIKMVKTLFNNNNNLYMMYVVCSN